MKTLIFLVYISAYGVPLVKEVPTMRACESIAQALKTSRYLTVTCIETPAP